MIDSSFPVSKLANFRDLGGQRSDYGVTRRGQLFRSDDLATIDEQEAERIAATGISLIIDLRSPQEIKEIGRGPLEQFEIGYVNAPLLTSYGSGNQIDQVLEADFTNQMLGQWYAKVFLESLPTLVSGIQEISESSGPTVFHCAVGKDRTGIFAATLLSVLGVSSEAIVADYNRTNDNLRAVLARLRSSQPFWTEELMVRSGALMRADSEAMETMLGELGSASRIQDHLLSGGLTLQQIANLRAKFLEA
jgi:protein-tyrosine phosphatase